MTNPGSAADKTPMSGLVSIGRDVRGDLNLRVEQVEVSGMPVAVAIVILGDQVLMVRRRKRYGELDWQFPAGIVKPDDIAADVARDETFAETSVLTEVIEYLGTRLHPVTQLKISYFLCSYVAGEPQNMDPRENSEARWVRLAEVYDLVPKRQIFKPIQDLLE